MKNNNSTSPELAKVGLEDLETTEQTAKSHAERYISTKEFLNWADTEQTRFEEETTETLATANVSIKLDQPSFEQVKKETGVEKSLDQVNQDAEVVLNQAKQLVMKNDKYGETRVENLVADVDATGQPKLEAKFDQSKYDATVKAITELTRKAVNLDQNQLEAEIENINRNTEIFNDALHEENHKNQALSKIHQVIKNGYDLDVPELMNLGINIAEQNLEVLSVEPGDQEWTLKDKLNIISKLLRYGNEQKTTQVIEALVNNTSEITKALRGSNNPREYIEPIELLLEHGNDEVAGQCELALKELMEINRNSQNKQPLLVLGSLCESGAEKVANKARDILGQELSLLGLDGREIIDAWLSSSDAMDTAVATNLPAIYELEAEKQGESVSKTLFQQFGICNFGRYPKDLLLNQFEQRNNSTQSYGIAIYPYSDSQAYFYDSKLVFEDLYKDLKEQQVGIRVIEAQSKLDIRKALVKLERQHKDNKIQFIIIGGHGTQNSIQFGSQFKHQENLRIEDLQDERMGKNKSIFVEHPTIILNSCSTGVEGGIAQELSQKLGAETIAPDATARIMSIKATKEDGRLDFRVTYNVGTKVYDNGKNVTTEKASQLAKGCLIEVLQLLKYLSFFDVPETRRYGRLKKVSKALQILLPKDSNTRRPAIFN